MAGFKRPSFLKKQKEALRSARAARKREERKARKIAKAMDPDTPGESGPPIERLEVLLGEESADEEREKPTEESVDSAGSKEER